MKKLGKCFKWLTISVSTLLLIVLISLGFLLFTTPGLKITKVIANHFLQPLGISIEGEIKGQINRLQLQNLDIKNDVVNIHLSNVQLSLSLWALVAKQKLDVNKLNLSKVYVDVNTNVEEITDSKTQHIEAFDFSMPLDLNAYAISIDQVDYLMNNELIVQARSFSAKNVSLIKDKLSLDSVAAQLPQYQAHAFLKTGFIILNAPFSTTLDLNVNLSQQGVQLTTQDTTIRGDFGKLFQIVSKGDVYYQQKPYPYVLTSLFNGAQIDTKLILNHIAEIDNTLLFSNKLNWSLAIKSLNQTWPVHLNAGGILNTKEDQLELKTKFCDVFANEIKLNCVLKLTNKTRLFQLDDFSLTNPHNNDSIVLQLTKNNALLKAKWEVFITNLNHYPFSISGGISSKGNIAIDDKDYHTLSFNLDIRDFLYKNFDTQKLILNVDNTNLSLSVDSNDVNLALQSKLKSLSLSTLIATIDTLNLTLKKFKQRWQIMHPSTIKLSPTNSSLSTLCLMTSSNNRLCLEANFSPRAIIATLHGRITPVKLMPNLPYGNDTFVVDFDSTYSQEANENPIANVNVTGKGFFFGNNSNWFKELQAIDPIHKLIYLTHINASVDLKNKTLTSKLDAHFPQNSIIAALKSSDFEFAHLTSAMINGNINVKSTRLGWISNFFPKFPTLIKTGALNAKLSISNNFSNPNINGNLKLDNGTIELLPLNTTLTNLNANIKINTPLTAQIEAQAMIDHERLSISGTSLFQQGKINTNITITGHKLKVINTPDIEVIVSPKLNFSQQNSDNTLTGSIFIDQLIVNLAGMKGSNLQNTIQNDVVYVNNNQALEPQKKIPFSMNINIDMGQNASISGLGINTNIEGTLNIISKSNEPMLGIGALQPVNGIFTAYGKRFTVDPKSRVLFNSSSVNNPLLSITTYYNIPTSVKLSQPDVPETIGIQITGTANNPKVQLFSNPAMSQTDILSFILFGQVLTSSNSNQTSSDSLSQMALLIAINEGGSSVIDELKDRLSLTEFSLGNLSNNSTNTTNGTSNTQNNTAVFIGKQITPRLYLSYGVGIFTGEQQGIATFSLTPQWKLKGEVTSFDKGGDILYQTHSKD